MLSSSSMTEITTMVGGLIVSAVVVILTTILVMLFSRSGSRDSTNKIDGSGDGVDAGGLPISNTSSIITEASSSSSSSGSWKYDVFLSFRGEDTRKTFVDHLYSALDQRAIRTYKDDVTLARGDTIGPALLSAIQESHIALVVFSKNYADSSWCLDELSYIMKCKEERGQIVMPIFYHVDPSDVRKQKGEFGKAFAKHERSKNNKNKVVSWKKSLIEASNIAGWEPKHVTDGHEAKCIQEIVGSILDKLSSLDSAVEDEDFVGMGTRLKQLKSQLRIESRGVRMVGIWGLGGGGKTTLAASIYTKLCADFHGCCFLVNIREESKQQDGLKSLQEKILKAVFHNKIEVESVELGKKRIKGMLCRRKVLIVLDDVDHLDQLKALAGSREWFGDGSRIIITTRNQHLLTTHRVDDVSPISLLSRDEALRLFRRHAYHEDKPVQDYEILSQQIVSYAAGLPLALIVLGSFLYDKNYNEWLSTLARLKHHPEMDIVEKLKISYDGLKDVEKELFLDIACIYRGWKSNEAMEILDACGFYPHIGVKVLIQKALITISPDDDFDMHDLVQEMGHYIVRGKHPNNPEKHSRLWRNQDIEDICLRNATMENNKIEAISCPNVCSSNFIMLVSNMKKLRFLQVTCWFFLNELRCLHWESSGQGPSFLSNELRYLNWTAYPVSPFPESFQPRKLVVLKLKFSLQKEVWKGYKYLPSLKELVLSEMGELVRTPDFGGLPCLQKLTLDECKSLEEIHKSLGNHSSLVSVEVRDCDKLTWFPSIVRMEKLEILQIIECPALVEFPKIEAKMDKLVELSLESLRIEVVPSSVGEYCTNLISLKLETIKCIEGNFPRFLRKLKLDGCGLKDGEIPTEIGELSNLQELNLKWNDFTRLDFSLSRLTRLKLLNLSRCENLVELPELPSSLAILKAVGCWSLEVVIRDEIHPNCKWLSQVSILGVLDVIGGERLLERMLQGNAVESGCMWLEVQGSEIPRGFEPPVVRARICRMQLPSNWFHDFSGFLICQAFYKPDYSEIDVIITMKHVEKLEGDSQHDDVYLEEEADDYYDYEYHTWVGYISFDSLRNTLWWDPTSTAIQIETPGDIDDTIVIGCGLKLVPKRGGGESSSGGQMGTTTTTHSSSSEYSDDDDYKCKLDIKHDSKSAFKFRFDVGPFVEERALLFLEAQDRASKRDTLK